MGQAYTERAEGVNALASAASDKSLDFVEGLAFSPDHSVVMTGTMVDAPDASGRVNRIGKWWKPWFFSHAKTMLKHGTLCTAWAVRVTSPSHAGCTWNSWPSPC